MANFGIWFFTKGYKQTFAELGSIEDKAKGVNTGFRRMGTTSAGVGATMFRSLGVVRHGASAVLGVMKTLGRITIKVTGLLIAAAAAVSAVGIALATKFTKGLMMTRENFYLIETALTGVIKNAAQVRKISDWAMRYAAEYPAMYEDVMGAMKGLAMMPSLKPMFTQAAVADMEKIMNVVQGLAAMDPQQGVRGALFAIREALGGQWRSLMMRFEIKPVAVAEAAGLTMAEIKKSPQLAIKALKAFVDLNVGAATLRKSAETLGVQWGNLSDKYQMWLNTVAQYGAYRKLVEFLMQINTLWDTILMSDAAKKFGQDVSRVIETIVGQFGKLMIIDVDWEKEGMFAGFIQAARNVLNKLKEIFQVVKPILEAGMKAAIAGMAKALIFLVKDVFWPVGVEIGRAIAGGVSKGLVEYSVNLPPLPKGEEAWGKVGGAMKARKVSKEGGIVRLPVTMPEETAWDKFSKSLKTTAAELAVVLGVGPRKEIKELSTVEEQMKRVVEGRANVRIAEVTGTKEQLKAAKSQLEHEKSMLDWHQRTKAWEASERGKRFEILRKETNALKEQMSIDIDAGKVRADFAGKEAEYIKKTTALEKLRTDIPEAPKRYRGVELEERLAEVYAKKNDLARQVRDSEKEIAGMREKGVVTITEMHEKEEELVGLKEKQLSIEKEREGVRKSLLNLASQRELIELAPGKLDRATRYFKTFAEFMKGVSGRAGQVAIPGLPRTTWAEAVEVSGGAGTAGIPKFFLKLEDIMREQLVSGDKQLTTQKILLERLYDVNIQQFAFAKGVPAKYKQFMEATELQGQLAIVNSALEQEKLRLLRNQEKIAMAQLQKLEQITINTGGGPKKEDSDQLLNETRKIGKNTEVKGQIDAEKKIAAAGIITIGRTTTNIEMIKRRLAQAEAKAPLEGPYASPGFSIANGSQGQVWTMLAAGMP